MDRALVTISQAMEATGVSRRAIYNWINKGKIEYIRTAGGAIRIYEDSLWRKPNGTPLVESATEQ